MPGGRLTQQERRQIALGLADSLAYAEIARRLDRPTSTITREVMRNGGPTAYRADLAHRATEHRAHRRRSASSRGPEPVPRPHGCDTEAVAEYEETFTTVPMASGLTKMAARVLTSPFTTDAGSLTASLLAQRLRISPASVSEAIAFLESQSLVRRVARGLGRSGNRRPLKTKAHQQERAGGQRDWLSVGLRITDFGDVLGQVRQGDLYVQRRHEFLIQRPQGIQVTHRFQIHRDLVIVLGEALESFG